MVSLPCATAQRSVVNFLRANRTLSIELRRTFERVLYNTNDIIYRSNHLEHAVFPDPQARMSITHLPATIPYSMKVRGTRRYTGRSGKKVASFLRQVAILTCYAGSCSAAQMQQSIVAKGIERDSLQNKPNDLGFSLGSRQSLKTLRKRNPFEDD
jgi:hypothetical protein